MKNTLIATTIGLVTAGLFLFVFGTEEEQVIDPQPNFVYENYLPVQYVEFEPMQIIGKKNQNKHLTEYGE